MKKRKTNEQYDADLIAAGGEHIRLEPYMGNKTKILHRHVRCGYEWEIRPDNLMNNPGICPDCAQSKRKSTMIERYGVECAAHIPGMNERRNQTMMDRYGALISPRSHQAIISRIDNLNAKGRQTLMERYGVVNAGQLPGHGEYIRQKKLLTDQEYDARLDARPDAEYTRLEPYLGMGTKILHRHDTCGHEWRVVPGGLTGCPACATYGFSDSDIGHLYLLDVNGVCIKYGITNDIVGRQQSLRRLGGSTSTVIRSWQFERGSAARDIERLIKLKFGGSWAPPELLPNGWTETLDSGLLPEVIAFIEDALKDK